MSMCRSYTRPRRARDRYLVGNLRKTGPDAGTSAVLKQDHGGPVM